MKKQYEMPITSVKFFEAVDILTTSGVQNETPDEPNPFAGSN